ncbi:hypothetical protein DID76_02090 [Candidatus Marinamargulisbacteria bacterium SCGC AG-414-C22]|nr:hypothetical protein DID76_02090 [Candidatus Marinamargulisbacteria bacterium SCGC AG-414-C22]
MTNLTPASYDFHLVIFTNSPGEISTWVMTIIDTVKPLQPNIYITVCLTPCDYASGNEYTLLSKHSAINNVLTPKETMKSCFLWKKFHKKANKGAVLFLGGDPLYPQLLGLQLKFPIYGYSENTKSLGWFYKKTFYKPIDGDLMGVHILNKTFNKEKILQKYNLDHDEYCLFLPGSRPAHFSGFFPILTKTIQHIKAKDPAFPVVICLSPFIDKENKEMAFETAKHLKVKVVQGNSLELMYLAKLMVSLPGTNTAEAFYLKCPMLTILPLNRPDLIIFDGLLNIICKLPLIGMLLKKSALYMITRKDFMLSLPNKMAKKVIVPQQITNVEPKKLSNDIINLFKNSTKLVKLKKAMLAIQKHSDIHEKICSHFLNNR